VEEDHGADAAREVAQSLLVYMQRAGGQSQFSAPLAGPAPRSPLVRAVADLIWADPAHPSTVQELATHAMVSVRHLTRLGISSKKYQQRFRSTVRSPVVPAVSHAAAG
jgi:transcriptional regulator GlxA family with amidase domain